MEDINQLELHRETLFKDAVLNAAETKGMEIIAEAQTKSAEELAKARKLGAHADHDAILARVSRETEKDYSLHAQQERRKLLSYRGELVDQLFSDVEKRLAAFTETKEYDAWLLSRAERHAELGPGVVWLARGADIGRLEKAAKKAGAGLEEDASIRLGGIRLRSGARLYDETFDAALRAERERFTIESGLSIR